MKKRRIALDIAHTGFVENYRISAARGVIRYARQHTGWQLLYNEANFSLINSFEQFEELKTLGADGIIFYYWEREKLRRIQDLGIPMVSMSNDFLDVKPPFATVLTDDEEVGRLAARHFLERGFRQFAFYGDDQLSWEVCRLRGFREVLGAAGHDCATIARGDFGRGLRTARALDAWLAKLPVPIAIMAGTDSRALNVLEACNGLGLQVPRDVAILGVDNNPLICDAQLPSLSSVTLNPERVGYLAASLLDRMLRVGRQLRDTVLVPPLGIETRMSSDIVAVEDEALARALVFLRDHAHEAIRLDDVARAAGLSRSTLERRVREAFNCTVNDLLRQRRLERAKALLLDPALSLQAVAEASGFRRATYLCNVFQTELQTTPAAWRARNR